MPADLPVPLQGRRALQQVHPPENRVGAVLFAHLGDQFGHFGFVFHVVNVGYKLGTLFGYLGGGVTAHRGISRHGTPPFVKK